MKKIVPIAIFLIAGFACSIASAQYTKTKNPIVLVHGLSGFDSLGGIVDYWYTIPYNLRRSGATVYVAKVTAFESSEVRGQQLANYLMSLPEEKFNLVGHSQGAPTTRVAAALLPHKVASVTSVNGANLGSPVADLILGVLPEGGLSRTTVVAIADALGSILDFLSGDPSEQNSLAAAETLSTAGSLALNQALGFKGLSQNCQSIDENVNIDGHNIKMFSWSGVYTLTNIFDISDGLLSITSLAFGGEPNDGLVSECSSKLGNVINSRYHMNHIDPMNHVFGARGWTNPVSLYRSHANRLKNRGL